MKSHKNAGLEYYLQSLKLQAASYDLKLQTQLTDASAFDNTLDTEQIVVGLGMYVVKIAYHMARKYNAEHLLEDIIQEGNLAVFNAIKNYKTETCAPFIYVASLWIKTAVIRYIANQRESVSLPAVSYRQVMNLEAKKEQMISQANRDQDYHQIVSKSGISPVNNPDVYKLFTNRVLTLSALTPNSSFSIADTLTGPDEAALLLQHITEKEFRKKCLSYFKEHYNQKTVSMLIRWLGWNSDNQAQSINQIADADGLFKQSAYSTVIHALRNEGFLWFFASLIKSQFGLPECLCKAGVPNDVDAKLRSIEQIILLVCSSYNIKKSELCSKRTGKQYQQTRMICAWLCFYYTKIPTAVIAAQLGISKTVFKNRLKAVNRLLATDQNFAMELLGLEKQLKCLQASPHDAFLF